MKKANVTKNRRNGSAVTVISALILVLSMMLSLTACSANGGNTDTDSASDTIDAFGTVGDSLSNDNTGDGADTDETKNTGTDKETDEKTNADTEAETDGISAEDTSVSDTETSPSEDDAVNISEPEFINPLTGLLSDVDLSNKRPVALMINNIKRATPQHGITDADILYEVLAEGGITRLLMVVTEYEDLGIIGAIRSTRPYYLDYVLGMDAILAHAGGSDDAYTKIDTVGVLSLDGVRMNLGNMFYRDEWRKENMGYEHSLMTTGERIVSGIKKKKYDTNHDESFENTMEFVDYGTRVDLDGKAATHVKLKYSGSQIVDLIYDESTDKYLRYQFNGYAHIDKNNGEQLTFDNIVIIRTEMSVYDASNHLDVRTTGTGKGYFVAGGEYIEITWSKKDIYAPLIITDKNGNIIEYNRGKTFISIFNEDSTCKIDTSSFTPKS